MSDRAIESRSFILAQVEKARSDTEPLELVVEDDLVIVFDGRVLEIFRSIEQVEPPSVRFLVSRLEIREGEHKGRALIRLSHRGKYDGRSGLSFPPEQAEDARRLVDALVAAGATRV